MTVRANWHEPPALGAFEDPFGEPRRIGEVGTPIALDAEGETAELQRRLARTLQAEAKLEELGATCAIKAVGDTSCHACPLYREDDTHEAQLCAIGRLQERLCTQLVVAQRGGRR